MLYILSSGEIGNLPARAEGGEGVDAKIFCRKTDSFKADDVNRLLAVPGKVELVPVSGKDDMLVCLGGILETCGECTILDASVPVPERYAGKVVKTAAPKKRAARKKKAAGKKESAKDTGPADQAAAPKAAEVPEDFMPRPTGNAEETDPGITPKERTEEKGRTRKAGHSEKTQQVLEESREVLSLVPEEGGDPDFSDDAERRMYGLLHIKASDIGFTWPTSMLMSRIIQAVAEADSDGDIEMSVKAIRNGEKVWDALKDHLPEAKEIAKA